jgi:outer membrane protein assembly factor BamA
MAAISRCLASALMLLAAHAAADNPGSVTDDVQHDTDGVTPDAGAKNSRSFIALPIPVSNPALGSGLVLVGTMFYKPDTAAQPWVTGIGVLGTDNKSRALAAFQKADFDEGRFRLTAGIGHADLNLKFYGIGAGAGDRDVSVPIEQVGSAVIAKALMRVEGNFYAGIDYRYIDVNTRIKSESLPFPDLRPDGVELNSTISLLGMDFEYDSRDRSFTPRQGSYATLAAGWSRGAFGSDFNYDTQNVAANHYMALGDSLVLAARLKLCHVGTGAPFYDLCLYGAQSDLRGYEAGRYRDHALLAAQGELRWQFASRWGAVAFAGSGGVGPAFGAIDKMLPAGGVGLRFLASTAYHVNARLDYAVGKDGGSVYFSIGEAF